MTYGLILLLALQKGSPTAREIAGRLESQRVNLDFKEVRLDEALYTLTELTGLRLAIDPRIWEDSPKETSVVTLQVRDVSAKSAFKLILEPRRLTLMEREGVVTVTHKKNLDVVKTKVYEVGDLLLKIKDFAGPLVKWTEPSGGPGTIMSVDFYNLPEEDIYEPIDFLQEFLLSSLSPKHWAEVDRASFLVIRGRLHVTGTQRLHDEVEKTLLSMRQFR